LFVGLLCLQVKPTLANPFNDTVVEINPPFEITLKKAGAVRLAGLLYDDTSTALKTLLDKGMRVRVHLLSDKPDRYGRKPALVYLKDGRWLQGELVRQKLAIAYPYPGEESFIRDLYLHETPHAISALENSIPTDKFAIVEGQVVDVAEIKGKTYLNFGANWRTDFTIMVDKKKAKLFRAYGFSLPILKGSHMRIRGWVFDQNGPMIAPQHPSQLEMIKK